MIVSNIEKKYKKFMEKNESHWDFGNEILYSMCQEHPKHNQEDVIIGKIWLIGRSYAAAIERRKKTDEYQGDDFYFDVVAPKMMEIGKELDYHIEKLKRSKGLIVDDVEEILCTHKFLMDAFYEMTGLEKRSLASKYLHFHCPDKFFIYDGRARNAIGKIVSRPYKSLLTCIADYDNEYGDFVCRMIEFQKYLDEKLGVYEMPRKLDGYLLSLV